MFQATFFDGTWRGHADFLLKRPDRTSDLGRWAYDVADTKLARRLKVPALLQMALYGDLLAGLQGVPPELLTVVTGDQQELVHRYADVEAYARAAHVLGRDAPGCRRRRTGPSGTRRPPRSAPAPHPARGRPARAP